MRVFISWSGVRAKAAAQALRGHLPNMLAGKIIPFVSSEDIDKGTRGLDKVAKELENAAFGIVVVTPENRRSEWLNFEAGALGKSLDKGRVSPFLVGLTNAELDGPIKQFQTTVSADKADVLALLESINKALGGDAIPHKTLTDLFGIYWVQLEADLQEVVASTSAPTEPVARADRSILEEILNTVRDMQREVNPVVTPAYDPSWDRPVYDIPADYDYFMSMFSAAVPGNHSYLFEAAGSSYYAEITKRSGETLSKADLVSLSGVAASESKSILLFDETDGREYRVSQKGFVQNRVRFVAAAVKSDAEADSTGDEPHS